MENNHVEHKEGRNSLHQMMQDTIDQIHGMADSNAVGTLNATALSGVLGMTLDGMLPAEEESAPESAPASESGSASAASAAD